MALINYKVELSMPQIKSIFGIPQVIVGVLNNKPILGRKSKQYKRNLIVNYKDSSRPVTVNQISQKGRARRSYTVGDVFSRIRNKTPFERGYLGKSLTKIESHIWIRYIESSKNDTAKKKLSNGILNVVLHSYFDMAHRLKPKTGTITAKGHSLYYIQTGQTYKSIKAKTK